MSNLKIIIAPDPRLLEVSKPVKEVNNDIKNLLEDMLQVMYRSNGIGLAAPQVGILKRLIVMDCSDKNTKKEPLKFVNPEILNLSSDKSEFEEGCLSLPTQYSKVERPSNIEVEYKDENGNKCRKSFSGIEATCLQHEIDHLNGKLFVDHISKLKKNRIIKKLEKIKKTKNY
ncbi:MAG: peptide deformylase [Alphaproteobacteria bacterium TMED93]|nr:MAG: peptide deformylase [Alphaproteobacteria bacterium TMED93]